jgi:hypothetical protein
LTDFTRIGQLSSFKFDLYERLALGLSNMFVSEKLKGTSVELAMKLFPEDSEHSEGPIHGH